MFMVEPGKLHWGQMKSRVWRLGSNPSAASRWLCSCLAVTSHGLSIFTCKMGIMVVSIAEDAGGLHELLLTKPF